MSFGYGLPHPFRRSAGGVSLDEPFPWPVTIGGVGYAIDLKLLEFAPPDPFRAARDTGQQPGELSLNPEGSWKRNQADWTLGAGQEYRDDDGLAGFASSPRRYRASKGIDSLSTRRQITCLHDTAKSRASAASGLQVLTAGSYAYAVDGSNLAYTLDPFAATPSWSTAALGAAHSSNAVSDGSTVWCAAGGGVRKSTVGAATTALIGNGGSTFAAERLGYVNGWLLGALAGRVIEIAGNGNIAQAGQLDYTHPAAGWHWLAFAGAPNGIYAAGSSGDYSALYFIGVDSTGKLTVPTLAAELPRGDVATCLAYYGERVFVGTSQGFHLGQVLTGDGIALGPLIASAHAVACANGEDRFVYFGWTNYDGVSTGLGRAELGEFLVPNVPGYASDLMAGDTTTPVQGTVTSVATLGGRRLFAVDGIGVYAEALTYVAKATIDLGWFTFGVFEPKAYSSVEVVTAPLAGTVGVSVVDPSGVTTPLGTLNTANSTSAGLALPISGLIAEQARVTLTLNRDATPTKAPVVRRVTVRALPNPALVRAWSLPVILTSKVRPETTDEGLADQDQDVAAKLAHLEELAATQRTVIFQVGARSYRVTVRTVGLPQGMGKQWSDGRAVIEGTYLVKLVSVDVGN